MNFSNPITSFVLSLVLVLLVGLVVLIVLAVVSTHLRCEARDKKCRSGGKGFTEGGIIPRYFSGRSG